MSDSQELFISSLVRKVVMECLQYGFHRGAKTEPFALFHSPATQLIKQEIVEAGRKLWHRQYVDGNGGNISVRLSRNYILCTPTLCSKGDLRVEDLSLVDLDNNQVCGNRPQTSEIRLHLEIYKTVQKAVAVIHCHPPFATAHAIAGVIPQGDLVPEQEVFVGQVALAPYETPGTAEFAKTVVPFVEQHNTILLANHGIVCWADTITRAEWFVEVIETYCKTLMIAKQLRSSLPALPQNKIEELLRIKASLGLPDARLPREPRHDGDDPGGLLDRMAGEFDKAPGGGEPTASMDDPDIEAVVASITERICSVARKREASAY
jgi:L-fuculose-phosphate aldolase